MNRSATPASVLAGSSRQDRYDRHGPPDEDEARRQTGAAAEVRRVRRALRWRRVRWTLVALLAGLLAFVSVTAWQVVEAAHRAEPNHPAGAAVVMGAAQYGGVPSGALAGRLDRAAELYHQGLVRRIVVTGGNQPGDRTTEGMTGFVYLRERGVPEAALLVENGSTNTWEQLLATALIVSQHHIEGVIVVSDPYHNRRVLDIADQLGLDAQVAPADSHVSARQLARETIAVAVGRVIGYRRLTQLAQ